MDTYPAELASRRRSITIVILSIVFVVVLSLGLVRLIVPRQPPASVSAPPPLGPPLTAHLAFIIIDGLRYDVGTDPVLMPNLARRMATYASAESWANPISMTSSAILTYATGQRATVEQIITNESGSKVGYNSFMQNALAAGLTTACTGDKAWFRGFPDAWTLRHPDPYGVAIDVDYNAEIFAAADEFIAKRPGFLLAHFVTPDHQGHAYGVLSERYRAHIHAFDQRLEVMLAGLPDDTTVIITSDHGMTDTGTHGSDTPLQRRSPFVAYGPGIAPRSGSKGGPRPASSMDQIDIAGTIAALLGVPSPAHGRGHLLVDWLDIPEEERARIACADLTRLRAYASASLNQGGSLAFGHSKECEPASGAPPRERVISAARAAADIDRSLDNAAVAGLPFGWLVPLIALVGALALSFFALRSRFFTRPLVVSAALLASAAVVISGILTYSVELLPGQWPNGTRVVLYALAHLVVLAAIFRPRAAADLLDRRAVLGAALFPGALVITPTRITQVEAFVAAVLIAGFVLIVGLPRADPAGASSLRDVIAARARELTPSLRARRWIRAGAVIALLALVHPIGIREGDFFPRTLLQSPPALLTIAIASTLIIAVERGLRARQSGERRAYSDAALGVAVVIVSLFLRRAAPPLVCLAGWLSLPLVALVAYTSYRRRVLAELLLLASYAWVSRDVELPIFAATLLIAGLVGDAFGEELKSRPTRPSAVFFIVTFLFAWTFVQRVGIETGLDFIHFDWGAGAFREPGVSMARIGAALVFKHGLARGAVIYAVLSPLPRAHRAWAALGLLVVDLMRAAALFVTLYLCRESFWTSLRVIGDMPHALTAILVAALAVLAVALTEPTTAAGSPSPRP